MPRFPADKQNSFRIKLEKINATKSESAYRVIEGRPDWLCSSTIMIHFKPQSKRVFILVKPAHLINFIIPAMASTRGKPLFNCFRAHVHASTRCLLSKEAPFQQPLRNGWPWATRSVTQIRVGPGGIQPAIIHTILCIQ